MSVSCKNRNAPHLISVCILIYLPRTYALAKVIYTRWSSNPNPLASGIHEPVLYAQGKELLRGTERERESFNQRRKRPFASQLDSLSIHLVSANLNLSWLSNSTLFTLDFICGSRFFSYLFFLSFFLSLLLKRICCQKVQLYQKLHL